MGDDLALGEIARYGSFTGMNESCLGTAVSIFCSSRLVFEWFLMYKDVTSDRFVLRPFLSPSMVLEYKVLEHLNLVADSFLLFLTVSLVGLGFFAPQKFFWQSVKVPVIAA